jgi:hypothetical protein
MSKTVPAAALLALGLVCAPARAALTEDDFTHLHKLIRPQPGEAKWAEIPWLTDLEQARKRSAELDRPLFVWRAGGGEVLGRA